MNDKIEGWYENNYYYTLEEVNIMYVSGETKKSCVSTSNIDENTTSEVSDIEIDSVLQISNVIFVISSDTIIYKIKYTFNVIIKIQTEKIIIPTSEYDLVVKNGLFSSSVAAGKMNYYIDN